MSGHGYSGRSSRSRYNDEYSTGHDWSSARSRWQEPPKTTVPRRTTQSTRMQQPDPLKPKGPVHNCRNCNAVLDAHLKCGSCGSRHIKKGSFILMDSGPTLGAKDGSGNGSTMMLGKSATVDTNPKPLRSTARNVVIYVMDNTGSIRRDQDEIMNRCPILYVDAKELLGDDLEILLVTFGDSKRKDKINVVQFGRGAILDIHSQAINQQADGGGNFVESQDLVGLYLDTMVDFSQATNVFIFFVTDEGIPLEMNRRWAERDLPAAALAGFGDGNTRKVFDRLSKKAHVYTILKPPTRWNASRGTWMRNTWVQALGGDQYILDLADMRRCVDVAVAVMAKRLGKMALFEKNFAARQAGNTEAHRAENITTVQGTILRVQAGGPAKAPAASTPDFFK